MQSQVYVVLQRLLGGPVWHYGLERLSQASPEHDQEAGPLRGRPASHSNKVPGVILNTPVSLRTLRNFPAGPMLCWYDSVTGRRGKNRFWVQMQVRRFLMKQKGQQGKTKQAQKDRKYSNLTYHTNTTNHTRQNSGSAVHK